MLLANSIQFSETISLYPCSVKDYPEVLRCIEKFELDNRTLKREEFITIYNESRLAGFGRIRQYEGFSEMCSTGILEQERNKGLGTILLQTMANLAPKPVYLVCIIPDFFTRLGFEICTGYPMEMMEKLEYCKEGLPVKEPYVVMRKLD